MGVLALNILEVCPNYYPYIGGVETHVQSLSEQLAITDNVTVATTDATGKLPRIESLNKVTVRRFKCSAQNSLAYSPDLKYYLANSIEQFDVVHAHDYYSLPTFYAAISKKRNRFIFTTHTGGSPSFIKNVFRYIYKIAGTIALNRANVIICVSEFEKQCLISSFKISPNQIRVIPNGINLQEFAGIKKPVDKGNKTILSVGRAEKYKGMQYLIKVLPQMNADINLRIVGKGPYQEMLSSLASTLGVADRVCFLNSLSRKELINEYFNADLFALLSAYESYGISVGEALCAKTPCLVANNSALSEWVDQENCFGVTYPINLTELKTTISKVIGTIAQPSSPKILGWDIVANQIKKLYVDI